MEMASATAPNLDQRYRILRKLGEGAMGEVLLVEHKQLGRREAIKILRAELAVSEDFLSRFRREARATNLVQHPNIVSVYDFGNLPDGRMFMAMEYVDGQPVDEILKAGGPMPPARALWVLAQLCDAVDYAHSRGVIHRDLKPSNLVLVSVRTQPDLLKVLDFGLAKIVDPDLRESKLLTRQGDILGTPSYMSPEQLRSRPPDPRMDIYAIGCIAFELVVGEPPFGGNTLQIFDSHMRRPPDRASARRPAAGIPPELDEVIDTCLRKDPEERFQSAADARAAIEAVPGFQRPRGAAAARPAPARPAPARPPAASDFAGGEATAVATDDFETAVHTAVEHAGTVAPAEDASDEQRRTLHARLLALGEALLAAGARHPAIADGVARARQLEGEIERQRLESEELARQAAAIEQRMRERTASVRFALGELRGEQSVARGLALSDLEFQIAELGRRLDALGQELDRELASLVDRDVTLAASRAQLEEDLAFLWAPIEPQLEALVEGLRPHAELETLADAVREARAAMTAGTPSA